MAAGHCASNCCSTGIFTTLQLPLGFTENGSRKREYAVSGTCMEENTLLMSGATGQCGDRTEATVIQITTGYNQGLGFQL